MLYLSLREIQQYLPTSAVHLGHIYTWKTVGRWHLALGRLKAALRQSCAHPLHRFGKLAFLLEPGADRHQLIHSVVDLRGTGAHSVPPVAEKSGKGPLNIHYIAHASDATLTTRHLAKSDVRGRLGTTNVLSALHLRISSSRSLEILRRLTTRRCDADRKALSDRRASDTSQSHPSSSHKEINADRCRCRVIQPLARVLGVR